MEWLLVPENWIALLTLTVLEIVLGIDNIVFIAILAGKLPEREQPRARQVGLALAMITRLLLLASIAWIVRLTAPLFSVFSVEISGRDLILLGGGLFLLAKSTHEIHDKLEGGQARSGAKAAVSFAGVITQIMLLDIIFSLDSVITAVGMANELAIMVSAVVIAVIIMLFASGPISDFVNRHPTVKMLALSFLLLIGMSLVVDGLH
ncbi:MAG: TerC family protein, partial [Anaerolineales bacterium]|nr:TerC family protein [Anaerolineales bacterium]